LSLTRTVLVSLEGRTLVPAYTESRAGSAEKTLDHALQEAGQYWVFAPADTNSDQGNVPVRKLSSVGDQNTSEPREVSPITGDELLPGAGTSSE
jgi:hypothetical protein